MRIYDTLIAADIYRDGGSLEARFRLGDGTFESLWLSIFGAGKRVYGELRVSADADGAQMGRVIPVGSEEEGAILACLRDFLRVPKVDVPFGHRTDSSYYLEKAARLLAETPRRRG